MEELDDLDEISLTEPIRTRTDKRRETVKTARRYKAKQNLLCYKHAYSRKQALSQMNYLLSIGQVKFLRTYKCKRCRHWHLTHQEEKGAFKNSVK